MEHILLRDRAWVEIDLAAILHNHNEVKRLVPEGIRIMAVIKADAYGHGAKEVAKALTDHVDAFGVATADEAISLRKQGIRNDILILSASHPDTYPVLVEYGIMPTVLDLPSAEALSEAAKGQRAGYYLAVDTGMTRIGVPCGSEGIAVAKKMASLPNLELCGVFSHFACADEADKTSAEEQALRFRSFAQGLRAEGVEPPCFSLSNSAGIMEMDAFHNMVREGIILYGAYPSNEVDRNVLSLRPAMAVKTRVSLVKTVPSGVGVSYGHTFVTEHETRIATLCIGYGDGVPRLLSGKGHVLLHGKRAPILGRVCMDQMMVDVTDIPETAVGDIATVIGRDGEEEITADEVAAHAQTISYEIFCSLNRPRLPRLYL